MATGGQGWVDSIQQVDQEGRSNALFCIFFISYVMLVCWGILQITVVVLLDSFMKAKAIMDHEEEVAFLESSGTEEYHTPFEPLLRKLAEDFTDDEDLEQRLRKLFRVQILTKFYI